MVSKHLDEEVEALKTVSKEKTKLVAWLESEIKKKDERIKELETVLAEIEAELKHKNKPWLA